jgi:Fe-S-cluster-containing dehydrogenase component
MASREKELSALVQISDAPRGRLSQLVRHLIYPFRTGEPPKPQPATGFFTDTTVCIGCKACEVACKQWNQLPSDGFTWSGNSYDNTTELSATTWRHVKFIEQFSEQVASEYGSLASLDIALTEPNYNRWLMMSDHCKHCLTAPCHQACPTGAIIQNEFQNVYIQADICNGCSSCVAACPFGVVARSSIRTNARSAMTARSTVLNRPAPRHVRPSPSTSARSTSCASRLANAWRNSIDVAFRRRTFMATLLLKPIQKCIRSTCLSIVLPFMACRMPRSIRGCT